MKKRFLTLLLAVLCVILLTACGECDHDWEKATCEEPKTCSECGETKGKALGHTWVEATCEEPKTCSECGKTKGEALDHDWMDATCEEPKTCYACGETEGEALDHDWEDATYDAPKTCRNCGETEGDPLPQPVSGETLGIKCEQYVTRINNAIEDNDYVLKYASEDEDGDAIYALYSISGDEYLDVVATFMLADDGETVTGVLLATEDIYDSDKVYACGFISGAAWKITNSNLTSEMVNEMVASTPYEGDDGSVTYYMEQDGLSYYIIITETMIIYMVDAE